MSGGFSIRKAMPADADALPAIEQAASEVFAPIPDLAWLVEADNMTVAQHCAFIAQGTEWVAVDAAGRVVGFLAGESADQEFHIAELDVLPERHGRGIGRALVETAAQEARESGHSALTLTTFSDIPWNAPFYARLGFTEVSGNDLGPHLRACVDEERRKGFPMQRRCAMRRLL